MLQLSTLKKVLFGIVLTYTTVSVSQTKQFKNYSYKELVQAIKVSIKIPRGFKETEIIPYNGHLYQYALKDSTTGFEVRYYIKPYALFYGKNEKEYKTNPPTYQSFLSSVINISNTNVPENYPNVLVINPEYVKHDMNAEYGLSCLIETGSTFTEGYTYCEAHAVRKDAIGEIFIFMLYTISNHETSIIRDDIFSSIDFY